MLSQNFNFIFISNEEETWTKCMVQNSLDVFFINQGPLSGPKEPGTMKITVVD